MPRELRVPISSVRGNLKGQRSYARNVVVFLTKKSFINTRKCVLHEETKPLIHSMKSLAVAENANAASSHYQWDNVLGNMDKDMYYEIIISDDTIQLIGKHIYDSKKPSKHKDICDEMSLINLLIWYFSAQSLSPVVRCQDLDES